MALIVSTLIVNENAKHNNAASNPGCHQADLFIGRILHGFVETTDFLAGLELYKDNNGYFTYLFNRRIDIKPNCIQIERRPL